ncbi:hypothetical protein DPX16_5555 [Anabarilius grahami]|uniref:Zinc finger BED domain-containing protein 4 n=1 Tax=Anabarilius grahami TaxID=495550 RepID=A0A3N0Y9U8_ANAGA|nr:hypothetical protein DPX16_5555 [Anabarilius grahami]
MDCKDLEHCCLDEEILYGKDKQEVLNLPQHSLLLDVKTRWNSLYLMLELFLERYPAIQAASLDQLLRKPLERRDDIRSFLEEATALDLRFKHKVEDSSTVWLQIKENLIAANLSESKQPPPCIRATISPLEELFAADDELKMKSTESSRPLSIETKVDAELKMYQDMPPTMTSDDPAVVETKKTSYFILMCAGLFNPK